MVGDDYQTIYSFTGASPEHLLTFPTRYPECHGGQAPGQLPVLAAGAGRGERPGPHARRVREAPAGHASGRTQPDGPRAARRRGGGRVRGGRGSPAPRDGVAFEEMAVLYRINARSEPFEEAFAAASIPYQVRDGSFLRRPGPRSVLAKLRTLVPGRRRGGGGGDRRAGLRCETPNRTTPRRSPARPTSLGSGRSPPSTAMPPGRGRRRLHRRARPGGSPRSRAGAA